MKFPILMYHRIEDSAYMHKVGLKLSGEHCSLERFRSQMEILKKNFTVWPLPRIMFNLEKDIPLPENVAAITFDDGTRDHLEVALPVLREFGFSATFAVMGAPIFGKIPPTFKMQLITGGGVDMDEVAQKYFPEALASVASEFSERYANGIIVPPERYIGESTEKIRQIKYLVNYLMPADKKDVIVDQLFRSLFANGIAGEFMICRKMFLSYSDMEKILAVGTRLPNGYMSLASHSVNHYNLATIIDKQDLIFEIAYSKKVVSPRSGPRSCSLFFYPAGGREGYTPEIVRLVSMFYAGACITGNQKEWADSDSDSVFELPRIHEKYFS